MSIRMMNMVFERYPSGGNEGMLALAVADHAHDNGTKIWPSLDSLAQKTKQSRSSVRRHLKAMVDSGWLELVNVSDGRAGGTNEYRINPEWIEGRLKLGEGVNLNPSPPSGKPVDKPQGEGVNLEGEGVIAMDREGVTAVVPESSGTVIEPSYTPPPPVGTGGCEQKLEQPKSESLTGSRKERRRWRWADKRSLIEARGEALAVAPWNSKLPSLGGETFAAYAARVFASHLATAGVTTSPGIVLQRLQSTDCWSEALRQLSAPATVLNGG